MSEGNISGMGLGSSVGFGMISMWIPFSSYHYWAARHFSSLSKDIEENHIGPGKFDIRQRSYVMSSICSCAFFIESFINEFLKAIYDGHNPEVNVAPENAVSKIKADWEKMERKFALTKINTALSLFGKPEILKSEVLFQDCELIFEIRNLIAHYKPQSVNPQNEYEIAAKLKPKFAPNKLMQGAGNAYFPDHCLGTGATEWAVESSTKLIDEFCDRVGRRKIYKEMKW